MGLRPAATVVGDALADQQLRQPVACPRAVRRRVLPRPAEILHRRLLPGGRMHHCEQLRAQHLSFRA